MPSPAKGFLDPLQGAGHPLHNRLASQLEVPPFGLHAVVREAQKVEGLRSPQPSYPTAPIGEPSELDEPGLVGVQAQFKASEALLYGIQEVLRVPLMLKTHHNIIGVPHDDGIAFDLVATPLLEPEIEDVVQVDVRQDRGNHRSLEASPASRPATLHLP